MLVGVPFIVTLELWGMGVGGTRTHRSRLSWDVCPERGYYDQYWGCGAIHRKPPQGTPAFKREGNAEHCPAPMIDVPFLASVLGKMVYLGLVDRRRVGRMALARDAAKCPDASASTSATVGQWAWTEATPPQRTFAVLRLAGPGRE